MGMADVLDIYVDGEAMVKFQIPFDIHLLLGWSGAGKTYLCTLIDRLKSYGGKVDSTISLDSILIWNRLSNIDLDTRDKLVIVDRYAYIRKHKPEIVDFIKDTAGSNKFVLISNRFQKDGYGLPSQAVYELLYDESTTCFTVREYSENPNYSIFKPIQTE